MTDDETAPDEYSVPASLGTQPGHGWVGLVPGTVTTGLWCDSCLLPSRYEAIVYVLGDDGPVPVGTTAGCTAEGHAA